MTRPPFRLVEDAAMALLLTVLVIGGFVGACLALAVAGWGKGP